MANKADEKEKREREKARRYWNYMERTKVNEKRSEILGKICIALNANDVDIISKLVESAFDAGHMAVEIKEVVHNCMSHPNFDAIYEFCRAMQFEENRRVKR